MTLAPSPPVRDQGKHVPEGCDGSPKADKKGARLDDYTPRTGGRITARHDCYFVNFQLKQILPQNARQPLQTLSFRSLFAKEYLQRVHRLTPRGRRTVLTLSSLGLNSKLRQPQGSAHTAGIPARTPN
ncbi:hypothetical protein SAMN04487981_1473 [Streptomyces sp. cf386]|nr:hypothetical protein SAMN04487981_1473 [Streptomyces sp. cf386]